ncbi:MAG: PEP-CTERM sorting domain-containing protein [Fimbriimonas sp.]
MRYFAKPIALFTQTAVIVAASTSGAHAAFIQLNAPLTTTAIDKLTPVVTSRIKFDGGGGVDSMLFKQDGGPAGYPGADLLRMNASNKGTATYKFSLNYEKATRTFIWALSDGEISGGTSFAGTGKTSTLKYTFDGANKKNTLPSFNILHLMLVTDKGAAATFSDFAFKAGSDLKTVGKVSPSDGITSDGGYTSYDQWLAAPTATDLSNFDWTITGTTTLTMNGTKPSAERLKLEITGKSGAYTPEAVPEPASMLALAAGAAGILRRRAKKA